MGRDLRDPAHLADSYLVMPPVGRPRTTTRKGNRAPTQELGVPDNYLGGFGISGLGERPDSSRVPVPGTCTLMSGSTSQNFAGR